MKRAPLLETQGFNQLARSRHGYYLYNTHDTYIGKAIEKYGEFCRIEGDLFDQILRPGNFVIEVGANIGGHTVEIARKVGPTGAVFAFEPQRIVFQALCANIALNSLLNVECHWAAVGAEEGSVLVPEVDPTQDANFGGVSLPKASQGRPVPCFTLDGFISMPHLALIKIDVEGMESDVIKGGKEIIARFKPMLYVENDRLDSSEALMTLIGSMGYRLYWHIPPLFNPDNFYGEQENIYPNLVSFNMLCIHRDTNAQLNGFTEITDFTTHPLRR